MPLSLGQKHIGILIVLLAVLIIGLSLTTGYAQKDKRFNEQFVEQRRFEASTNPSTPILPDSLILLRTDKQKQICWARCFGAGVANKIQAATVTQDSGFILVCVSDSCIIDHKHGHRIVITNAEGFLNSDHCYMLEQSSGYYECISILQLDDGRFILAGRDMWHRTTWLFCVSSMGDSLWFKSFDIGECRAIAQADDGGFIIAVMTSITSPPYNDGIIMKTDAAGNRQWMHTYGGEFPDVLFDMMISPDGRIIAVGDRHSGSVEDVMSRHDGWILILNSTGKMLRNIHYRCGNYLGFHQVYRAPDGGFLLKGVCEYNGLFMKISDTGDSLWSWQCNQDKRGEVDSCRVANSDLSMKEYLDQVINITPSYRNGRLVNSTKLIWIYDWLHLNGREGGSGRYGGAGIVSDGYFWAGAIIHKQARSE